MNINYLTTPESLSSTIQDDTPIYEWFLNLIHQPKFREDFCIDPKRKELYQKLDLHRTIQQCVVGLIFLSLIILLLFELYWLFGIAFLLIIVHYFTAKQLRRSVAEISLEKVNDDFPVDRLAQTTLYQLGEFYSKKYETYSIVDLLAVSHECLRTLLICLILLFLVVYPFIHISKVFLIIAMIFFSFRIIFNKSFIYKFRRK